MQGKPWSQFDMTRPPYVVREGEMTEEPDDEIWVRSGDGVHKLVERIQTVLDSGPYADVACIGASTVNIAVKAVAVLREKVGDGLDVYVQPYFSTVIDNDRDDLTDNIKTRVVLRVVMRNVVSAA